MDISEINQKEVKNYEIEKTDETDLLKKIFDIQAQVERKFILKEGVPERLAFGEIKNLHLPETCRHINDNILWRMVQEINEAVVALKNGKTWRETKYFTDVNEYLDEVADIMIYFINLCLASGIDEEELTKIVIKKIMVNEKRFDSKY